MAKITQENVICDFIFLQGIKLAYSWEGGSFFFFSVIKAMTRLRRLTILIKLMKCVRTEFINIFTFKTKFLVTKHIMITGIAETNVLQCMAKMVLQK